MMVELKYFFGQIIYLKTDEDQKPRIISEAKLLPGGCTLYIVSHGTCTSEHYDFEMTTEKNIMLTTTN